MVIMAATTQPNPDEKQPEDMGEPNHKRSSYLKLLNSIASDLDVMLNDICRSSTVPAISEPIPDPDPPTPKTNPGEAELLNQYVRGAYEEEGESDLSLDGTTSSRSASESSNSEAETFFSLDEDGGSVAVSDPETPPPAVRRPHLGPGGQGERPVSLGVVQDAGDAGLTLLERLIWTHPIWYLPSISRQQATHLLQNRDEGTFLVRQSGTRRDIMALSVRVGVRPQLEHYLIESTERGVHVEGSTQLFQAIPVLTAYYCQHVKDLPVQLILPEAILSATSHQDLTSLAMLGQDFWTSSISQKSPSTKTSVYHTDVSSAGMDISSKKYPSVKLPSPPVNHNNNSSHKVETVQTVETFKVTTSMSSVSKTSDVITNGTVMIRTSSNHNNLNGCVSKQQSPGDNVRSTLSTFTPGCTSTTKSTSQLNHKDNSAFQPVRRPQPVKPNCYNRGSLSKRLSDYADVWDSPTADTKNQFMFRPIRNGHSESSITMLGGDLSVSNKNPGYRSDSESEWEGPEQRKNKQTEHVEVTTTTHLHKIVPPGMQAKQPVVFKFDLNHQLISSKPPPTTQPPPVPNSHSSPAFSLLDSPLSQYSSPSYTEPFDSRIGRVDGVTSTVGAIRIGDGSRPVIPAPGHHSKQTRPHSTYVREKLPSVTSYRDPVDLVHGNTPTKLCTIRRSQSLKALVSEIEKPIEERAFSLPNEKKDLTGKRDKKAKPPPPVIHEVEDTPRKQPPPKPKRQTKPKNRPTAQLNARNITAPITNNATEAIPFHFKPPVISESFEKNFFGPDNVDILQEGSEPHMHRFPTDLSQLPDPQTTWNRDPVTVEEIMKTMSPDLTLRPVKPLTRKNLQGRFSDYDNINPHFNGPSSRRTTATSSVGTHYDVPWDTSKWYKVLTGDLPAGDDFMAPHDSPAPLASPEESYFLAEQDQGDCGSDPDYSSVCPPSEVLGSDLAASYVWHAKSDRDSATETTPQPPLQEDSLESAVDQLSCQPDSDDEGMGDDNELARDDFKNRLMPFLSTTRILSLRQRLGHIPGSKIKEYVSNLAADTATTFGKTIQNFIQCTVEGNETNPNIVVRNVRQFMNGIKNYLVQSGESQLNSVIENERSKLGANEFLNIDAIIEGALHKCVVKPLRQHMYQLYVEEYSSNGNLQILSENLQYARTKSHTDLGIHPSLSPPSGTSMEVIKHFLVKMQRAYSPLKKLENLLGATSSIYNTVGGYGCAGSSQESMTIGADDFLPMFIHVLVQAGLVAAEIEADYMWGLLHPCLLAGEGGYYLTTLSSAVHVLKKLRVSMESNNDQAILPSLGDLQGFMKIIMPDEKNDSIITKTLPVRPNMTTKDVCNMIAHKFKIHNPQDYGLYVLVMGVEDRLADCASPQSIRRDIQSENRECVFAYKRVNAKFGWPVSIKK